MSTRIHTASGSGFDPIYPRAIDVRLEDIACSLSKTCRFRGQIPGYAFYSVAQHAVHVAETVLRETRNPAWALLALHHDDGEAYLVDAPRPIKRNLYIAMSPQSPIDEGVMTFAYAESRVWEAIVKGLRLPDLGGQEWQDTIRRADDAQLSEELLGLFDSSPDEHTGTTSIRGIAIAPERCWSCADAHNSYLQMHRSLRERLEFEDPQA